MERRDQKNRTRAALLEAARALAAQGEPVTVLGAAEAAGVSRATAYRYFPDPQALAAEATLDLLAPDAETILKGLTDPRDRALAVWRALFALTRDNEPLFRAYLATALAAPAAPRGRRRMALYRAALAAVPEPDRSQVAAMLSGVSGVEARVALADATGLSEAEVETVGEAQVRAILATLPPSA